MAGGRRVGAAAGQPVRWAVVLAAALALPSSGRSAAATAASPVTATLVAAAPVAAAPVTATPVAAAPGSAAKAGPTQSASCLPQRRMDLVKLIAGQPLTARQGEEKFVAVTRGSPRWMAGFNLALSWENDDCQAFADFATQMGYEALEVLDPPTGEHHYVLLEKAGRHNGVFVFRAPAERSRARPLTITAPHVGFDFVDDRGIRLYRDVKAVAYLQNTAHRCSANACSSCSPVSSYACGGCPRTSDAAHSVDHLLFAVYAGLEAVRKDLRFEYHGAGEHAELPGCHGSAHLSQGSTVALLPQQDDGGYPNRFWRALERRLGTKCICYHQRERGCLLSGSASVFGRLTNEEPTAPFDPCGQPSTRLSGRFLHFEWHQVPIEPVTAALSEAVPLPH
jgi:hypothetical protein